MVKYTHYILGAALFPLAFALAESTQAVQSDNWFALAPVKLRYDQTISSLPSIEELMNLKITLGVNNSDFTADTTDCKNVVEMDLNELSEQTGRIDLSAIKSISDALIHYFESLGLVGIFVDPETKQQVCLEQGQEVQRPELVFTIYIARCGDVRTVSTTDLPNTKHYRAHRFEWIEKGSPVVANANNCTQSLINKKHLDEYAYYLNRYPGRKVDIEIHPLEQKSGLVGLDYVIIQHRPWRIYANISNTGPEVQGKWVTALGLIHTQAFFEDATFRADWAEVIGKEYHSSQIYYDFPLRFLYRSRLKLLVGYNRFSSTQLGFLEKEFIGKQYRGEVLFRRNLHQKGLLFVDGIFALDYRYINSINNLVNQTGQAHFLLPRVAIHIDKTEPNYNYSIQLGVSSTINGFVVGSRSELQTLGRASVDSQWVIFDWSSELSYYITPAFWKGGTFVKAHELYFATKGQYAFDYRLIAQLKAVIGGLYSVRGYPESFNSGDSVFVMNAEYRFHIPRVFKVVEYPRRRFLKKRPFRANPQTPGGIPDWDLMLRLFLDMGNAHNNKKLGELNTFLLSSGFGLEFILYENIFIRGDLGVVLKKAEGLPLVETKPVLINSILTNRQTINSALSNVGDCRIHLTATFMY